MAIRPFTFSDLFLLQNLTRYTTQLHIEQAVLLPRSPLWTVLRTAFPWKNSSCATYILRQEENGLARAGLIQVELRTENLEADVTLLAPTLDAPQGHPAIWQKLLSHTAQQLTARPVNRLYSDLPDQPLVVNTFKQAGFQLYARETVWRLSPPSRIHLCNNDRPSRTPLVRPCVTDDSWDLCRLYNQVTPPAVQHAEGSVPIEKRLNGGPQPLILRERHQGMPVSKFVLEGGNGVEGCVQVVWGRTGVWLHLWLDTNSPKTEAIHLLLRHALDQIRQNRRDCPIYIGVRDYQSGIESHLFDYGFAPFTDRARMVRTIWQWVQRPVPVRARTLEAVREVIPGSLVFPQAHGEGQDSNTTTSASQTDETWEAT